MEPEHLELLEKHVQGIAAGMGFDPEAVRVKVSMDDPCTYTRSVLIAYGSLRQKFTFRDEVHGQVSMALQRFELAAEQALKNMCATLMDPKHAEWWWSEPQFEPYSYPAVWPDHVKNAYREQPGHIVFKKVIKAQGGSWN